jgi:hypothetical protein
MNARLILLASAAVFAADKEKEPAKGKTDPAGAPLEARLIVKKDTCTLDRGGKTPAEYRAEAAKKPPIVEVDLVLELRNTGKDEIKVWVTGDYRAEKRQGGGDYVELVLDLKGPGAVSATVAERYATPATPPPKWVKLAPGKSYNLPITTLNYGSHGVARYLARRACWTEAGEYTLAATFKTAVDPAPPGSKETRWAGFDGGHVTVTTAPVKLKVVEKGKP